jgi:hypothetical protein
MRRRRSTGGLICFLAIVTGVTILFLIVLPPGFLWFLFGVALIVAGFLCMNRR